MVGRKIGVKAVVVVMGGSVELVWQVCGVAESWGRRVEGCRFPMNRPVKLIHVIP